MLHIINGRKATSNYVLDISNECKAGWLSTLFGAGDYGPGHCEVQHEK